MGSNVRRIGAAGVAVGLCLGAVSALPASAGTDVPVPAPAPVAGLLGAVDGGLLGGLVGQVLHGEGGIFGHDGGVLAGDDQLGDVINGLAGPDGGDSLLSGLGALSAVGDASGQLNIGGDGSFGSVSVGGGVLAPVTGVLGGLLSNGTGLVGGLF